MYFMGVGGSVMIAAFAAFMAFGWKMKIINNLTFKAILKTKGRKSGKEHTIWAKAVTYNDMVYFSRRNPNSDWLKNAIAHPQVKVKFDGKEFSGIARLVEEEELAKKISSLKYTDENRQKESRIVLEVKLSEKTN